MSLTILDEIGADKLFLQYDIDHAQRMEGEPGARRTGHRRDRLPVPVRSSRPHRVQGLGGRRVQARDDHRSRPRLACRCAPRVMREQGPPPDINMKESTT
jgi:hypothetical protein